LLSGDPHEAIILLEQAIAYLEDSGAKLLQADLPLEMAAVYLTVGDDAAAAALARDVLESVPVDPWTTLEAIQHLASVAGRSSQPVAAARLLGFTNARYQAESRFRSPFVRAGLEILIEAVRRHLTPEEVERYTTEGAQLDLQQAADLALGIVPED
jgi:hypothetical protein